LCGGNSIPIWLRKGAAQYFSGQYRSFDENMPHDQKVRLSASFMPLGEVSTSSNVQVGYPESAFVVAYLANVAGEDSLVRLLASLSSGES
jgi:hypothetical protein